MTSRASHLTAAVIGLAAILAGCAPTATAPQPTPTFSSDAEAFAAAEATYREYVKALNAVDLTDPETFEGVYAWTTGYANAEERITLSQMHADGWTVRGSTLVDGFHRIATARGSDGVSTVTLLVCSDVSNVRVVDTSGKSVVGESRPEVYALEVRFVVEVEKTLLIDSSNAVKDDRCN